MSAPDSLRHLEDVARDLDLVVYRLERATDDPQAERARLRRDLESLRDRIARMVRELDR